VRRFRGEGLPATPRIALITSDALGNYLVITPLLQMLRRAYPDARLTYFGGARTEELWEAEPAIDRGIVVQGRPLWVSIPEALKAGPFDLVINLEASEPSCMLASAISGPGTLLAGHALDEEGRQRLAFDSDERGRLWQDPDWISSDLVERFSFLDSGFIGSIFCRLCYLEGPVPSYRVDKCPSPATNFDVLVSTAASLPEKLWPTEKWLAVGKKLTDRGFRIGVVGASRTSQNRYWRGGVSEEALISELNAADLRGKLSLPQITGALDAAKAVVTIDNGILHLAASTDTPTVGLFRAGIARLWAPPAPSVTALVPPADGPVCDIETDAVVEAIGL
jgi:ADP-heptose:LPS heptosyltransferase